MSFQSIISQRVLNKTKYSPFTDPELTFTNERYLIKIALKRKYSISSLKRVCTINPVSMHHMSHYSNGWQLLWSPVFKSNQRHSVFSRTICEKSTRFYFISSQSNRVTWLIHHLFPTNCVLEYIKW